MTRCVWLIFLAAALQPTASDALAQTPQGGNTTAAAARPAGWRLAKGQTLRYQYVEYHDLRRVEGTLTFPVQTVRRTIDVSWSVEAIEAGDAGETMLIVGSIDRSREQVDAPAGPVRNIDSQRDGKDVDIWVGTELTFRLSSGGQVTNCSLSETSPVASEITRATREAIMRRAVRRLVPGLTSLVETKTAIQTWPTELGLEVAHFGLVRCAVQYLEAEKQPIDGPDLERFRFEVTADREQPGQSAPEIKFVAAQGKGSVRFDRASGKLQDSKLEMRIDGELAGPQITRLRDSMTVSWKLQK